MIELRRTDPRYPQRLLELSRPPDPLWLAGNPPDWSGPTAGIVGTRRLTEYGRRTARELASGLARAGALIVSGLAQGIDSTAHAAAVAVGGRTVAVLGEGLEAFDTSGTIPQRRLASAIRDRGALVSEYPPDTHGDVWTFPRRNATLAALSDVLIVVEAPRGSGALITADRSIDLGRPLFAVPGPLGAATWEGSNGYIADGRARLCTGPVAIAGLLGLEVMALRPKQAEPDRLLELLAAGPSDPDTIAVQLKVGASAVTELIARHLLAGTVVPTGDGRFARA